MARCTNCDAEVTATNSYYGTDRLPYCWHCWDARFTHCADCGAVRDKPFGFGGPQLCNCTAPVAAPTPPPADARQGELELNIEVRVPCANCGAGLLEDDVFKDPEGTAYCEECLNDLYYTCERCDDLVSRDAVHSVIGARGYAQNWCENCRDNYAFECARCNETYSAHYHSSYHAPDGDVRCQDCCDDFMHCDTCGDPVWQDDARCDDCGTYCQSCYDDNHRAGQHGDRVCRVLDPTTFERNPSKLTIGFEVEAFAEEAGGDFTGLGVIKDDGSIRPARGEAFEFASHAVAGDRLLDNIAKACNAFKRIDAGVNSTCGLHVHIGARHLTDTQRQNIVTSWYAFEPLMMQLVPRSRRDNQYCNPMVSHWGSDNRYHTLNTQSLMQHGTLEVRLHQGTVNRRKIESWIRFLLRFADTFEHVRWTGAKISELRAMPARDALRVLFQMVPMGLSIKKTLLARLNMYAAGASQKTVKRSLYQFNRRKASESECIACAE